MDYLPWLVILQHFHTDTVCILFHFRWKKAIHWKRFDFSLDFSIKTQETFSLFQCNCKMKVFYHLILTVHLLGRRAEGGHFSRGGLQEDQHQKFFSPRLLRRSHTYNLELSYLQKISKTIYFNIHSFSRIISYLREF